MSERPFSPEATVAEPLLTSSTPSAAPLTLAGVTVVFTGKLWSISRKEAQAIVERHGGVAEDEVTLRTTLLVVGATSYPEGVPDIHRFAGDLGTHTQKLRRAAQINAEEPGRIRLIGEDDFCRLTGLPPVAELREQYHAQRDILVRYPSLREDHLRYLQKWGFIRPAFKNNADTFYSFSDLTLLRQVSADVQQGISLRGVLRDLQAAQLGQLSLDFRIDAQPARILALKPREAGGVPRADARREGPPPTPAALAAQGLTGRALTTAEQYFVMGSLLDDGTPDRQEEAVQAYRRALQADPDLVAAIINLANISYARDALAEAQALYERAILLDPSYFEAHFNLGNIHHDHGHYAEAEACYLEALALNDEYADAHFYLAVTLEKMGRSGDARVHWRAYQALAPDGEWVELAREFSE